MGRGRLEVNPFTSMAAGSLPGNSTVPAGEGLPGPLPRQPAAAYVKTNHRGGLAGGATCRLPRKAGFEWVTLIHMDGASWPIRERASRPVPIFSHPLGCFITRYPDSTAASINSTGVSTVT